MREVLLVYQEVMLQNPAGRTRAKALGVLTASVDENPGVPAMANSVPNLPPVSGQHTTVTRYHEYLPLGTASILAALDLRTEQVTARVERVHSDYEFIALLQDLDRPYPPECPLRLVLDDHSPHLFK